MNVPRSTSSRNRSSIALATWMAMAAVATGWFALATFVTTFGPLQQVVHFYDLATVVHDPSWLVHGIGSHGLEAFGFGTVSAAFLLAPLGALRAGTRSAYLLFLLPLGLMVTCGLILYSETGQPYVVAVANSGAVGAFMSRVANQLVGGAADTIARHISLGAGAYVSFAATVYLALIGLRGYVAPAKVRASPDALAREEA